MDAILRFARDGGLRGPAEETSAGRREDGSGERSQQIPAGPLKARAVVEAIHSEGDNGNEKKATAAVCGEVTLGNEQFLRLTIELPNPEDSDAQSADRDEFTHIIVVADRSGSMSGNAWRQVQDALKQIIGDSYEHQDKQHVTLIIYNSVAKVGNFTEADHRQVIDALKCSGTTSFSAAFDAVSGNLKRNVGAKIVTRTIIAFMTDGQDTHLGNRPALMKAVETWKAKLARQDHPVIVHSVGFSRDHDYDFMCKLTEAGTEAGMYRYCQPDDGRDALQIKLSELFHYINAEEKEVDVEISLSGDDKLIGAGDLKGTAVIKSPIRNLKTAQAEEGADSAAADEVNVIVTESWIYVSNPSKVPKIGAVVHFPKGKNDIVQVVCDTAEVTQHVIADDRDKVMWSVRILSRNTDVLTTKVGETIKTGKGDIEKLSNRLKRLQERISKTKVYGRGITKEFRMAVLDMIKEIQAKVDIMHKMLAEYTRNKSSSVELLARANDLRYAAKFSKGRRQRLMDMRASRNLGQAQKAQQALDNIVIDETSLNKLSQEALDFFFCVLSQNNLKETLLDPDEKTDAIGFGLAVMRPEHVLDEPTGIWVHQISGTLVSRSAMMDAIQHRINVDGHLNTLGGFNFGGQNNRMGVATVGTSREPINSWLPLYVCDQHWHRVKTLMKPILGYFCTLDDLGYDYKQVDVMFMILGSMIGQISPDHCGEHQIRLLTAFHRTCVALCKEFELTTQIAELVRNFINKGEGRTRDCIPSLYALIGYVVSLPDYALKALFMPDVPGGKKETSKFWLAFISELLRRAARNQFRETSDSVVLGVIDAILHGNPDDTELVADALQTLLQWKVEDGVQASAVPPAFDVSDGVEVVSVERKHEVRVDKAMALWAQTACGHVVNKSRLPAVAAAKKVVNDWVEAGKVKAQTTVTDTKEKKQLDAAAMNKSAVEALAKMLKRLLSVAHPNLQGVVGCMAYLEFWLTELPDFTEVDANSGLVPDHWIEKLRKAVKKVYSCMDDSVRDQVQKVNNAEDDETETVNIIVTDADIAAETVDETVEDIYTAPPQVQGTVSEVEETVKPVDGGDDSEEDDFDYSDYDDDNDDGVGTARRQAHKKNKRSATPSSLNLPKVLRFVLRPHSDNDDTVLLLRGIVCQALFYNNNTKARDASKDGTMMDLAQGPENAIAALLRLHDSLQERRDGYLAKLEERASWQRANYCMVRADVPWAFIGYLMNTFTDRGEGVAELVELLTDPENAKNIPGVDVKLRILMMGKYKGDAVLANGNVWLPEKKTAQRMAQAMGGEEWIALELEVRSNVAIHVYRESDIPNRHGHCNSNPYIPNALRRQLGMPLMKENQPRLRGSRLQAAIKN